MRYHAQTIRQEFVSPGNIMVKQKIVYVAGLTKADVRGV